MAHSHQWRRIFIFSQSRRKKTRKESGKERHCMHCHCCERKHKQSTAFNFCRKEHSYRFRCIEKTVTFRLCSGTTEHNVLRLFCYTHRNCGKYNRSTIADAEQCTQTKDFISLIFFFLFFSILYCCRRCGCRFASETERNSKKELRNQSRNRN